MSDENITSLAKRPFVTQANDIPLIYGNEIHLGEQPLIEFYSICASLDEAQEKALKMFKGRFDGVIVVFIGTDNSLFFQVAR